MDLWAAMDAVRAAWSDEHVCGVARAFLAECDWGLESGDGWIRVPPNADLVVYSAAVIVSQYGFGDHVEAIVYLGADQSPSGIFPVHGVLRLYLNAAGQVLTEELVHADGMVGPELNQALQPTAGAWVCPGVLSLADPIAKLLR